MDYNTASKIVNEVRELTSLIVTDDHVKLLKHAHVGWSDCEFGAPMISDKRPYGNSSVFQDMSEILNILFIEDDEPSDEQAEELYRLHAETMIVLQIILSNGELFRGRYTRDDEFDMEWKFKPSEEEE